MPNDPNALVPVRGSQNKSCHNITSARLLKSLAMKVVKVASHARPGAEQQLMPCVRTHSCRHAASLINKLMCRISFQNCAKVSSPIYLSLVNRICPLLRLIRPNIARNAILMRMHRALTAVLFSRDRNEPQRMHQSQV